MSSAKRVLILGARGQLGHELANTIWSDSFEVTALGRSELDLTSAAQTEQVLAETKPDFVVNAAAYTAVDTAEDEPELANATNFEGVALLAAKTQKVGAKLVHISTDYVFDGTAEGRYVETDTTNPQGVYGVTKLKGEVEVLKNPNNVVLRTSWVYSSTGSNFVKTMIRLAGERDQLGVVDDQIGCPTSARCLAEAIVDAVELGLASTGLFHLAAPDSATWWEVADHALKLVGLRDNVEIAKLTTAEYPTKAVRPQNSCLDSELFFTKYGIRLKPWREALAEVCKELEEVKTKPVAAATV